MVGQWAVHVTRGELPAACELAEQALRLAEGREDGRGLSVAHRLVGVSALWSGRPASARPHLEQALILHDPARDRHSALLYAWDQRVAALACVAVALWQLGYPDQALARNREALAKARELADTASLAHALCHSCMLRELLGDDRSAFEQAGALEALCAEQRLRFPLWVTMAAVLRGAGSIARERTEEAVARMAQSLRGYQATGSRLFLPYWTALLAKTLAGAGRHPEALVALVEAREWADRTDQCWTQAELHRLRGRMLLRVDGAGAEVAFNKAMAVAREQAARIWELRAAHDLARLWAERGERRKAYDLLAPLYGWFSEGFDTPDLKKAGALLDSLR
jgi:predicted ATPase